MDHHVGIPKKMDLIFPYVQKCFLKKKTIFIKTASEHFLDLTYLMIPKVHFKLERDSLHLGRAEVFCPHNVFSISCL